MQCVERFPHYPKHGDTGSTEIKVTPDGGLLYISMQSVTFIKADDEKPLVKTFYTKQPIIEIDVDPGWSDEEKLFATLTVSNSILIWDLNKNIAISGHSAHCPPKQVEGGNHKIKMFSGKSRMSFMKNRNLMSISPLEIVVYCVASNTTLVRPNFITKQVKPKYITVLECSPYDEHIFACGTQGGAVMICDIQKSQILFSFNGHKDAVVSLSWNSIDRIVPEKKLAKCAAVFSPPDVTGDTEDIFNIYDYDYLENEFGAPIKDSNVDVNAEFQKESNHLSINPNFNFNEACESLKEEINALTENVINEGSDACVTLADCQQSKDFACTSSDGGSNESIEGSLEFVEQNSSSDDSCHVDGTDVTLTERDTQCEAATSQLAIHEKIQTNETTKVDILLLSASLDESCCIINTTTGAVCDRIQKSAKNTLSCSAIWAGPKEILCLKGGTIVKHKLNGEVLPISDTVRAYKLELDNAESSHIDSNVHVMMFDQARGTDILWYITKCNKIICFNNNSQKTVLSYDTVSSFMYAMCESPENVYKIAFGLQTNCICFMNTMDFTEFNGTKISLDCLPVRSPAAIKTFAWHDNGYELAYGTIHGEIGLINVEAHKHKMFDLACARPVFALTWFGELIFCICNDNVYAYKRDSRATLHLKGFPERYSSIMSFQKYLVLGLSNGRIKIYQQQEDAIDIMTFEEIQDLALANHYITDIVFNPIDTQTFAVSANEAYVYVLHFDIITATVKLVHKVNCASLKDQIHQVKWSNRQKDKFLASGYSGEICVFDLSRPNGQKLVFTQQMHCPIYSAMFLPSDERYILCTGKTITVEIIDTEQSNPVNYLAQTRSLNSIKWATQSIAATSTSRSASKRRSGKKKKSVVAPKDTGEAPSSTLQADLITKIAEIQIGEDQCIKKIEHEKATEVQKISSFLKSSQTALSLITKEYNKNPLRKIFEFVTLPTFKEKREAVLIAKLFGQKIDAEKVLAVEMANIKSSGVSAPEVNAAFLNQLNGGIRTQILDAIQTRQLKEWHVSVAPTISYSFWQKCCQAFAEQLLEQGHVLQAAVYLMSLHKQRETIEMLVSAKYFKEAMLIGRSYLNENDLLFQFITENWVEHLESEGNLHAAALICTVAENYKRAYEILAKQRVSVPEVEATIQLLKGKAGC